MNTTTFLKHVPAFRELPTPLLGRLAAGAEPRTFRKGQEIMARGSNTGVMQVIESGRALISLGDPMTERTGAVVGLGPGDLFGELSLLTGQPENAHVITTGPMRTLAFRRETLQPLLHEHPRLARVLTELLARRLGDGNSGRAVGKYRILGRLGAGASARVFKCLHPGLNRVVAVKMLEHSLAFDPAFTERFLQEARTVAGLSHPNIVQIYDAESSYDTYFLVMEMVDGGEVADQLRSGPLPFDDVRSILGQLADALAYAHGRGVVHRDIKPQNCLLTSDGQVKLMDFGLAALAESDATGPTVDGTPKYLAPEVAMGHAVDGRADIYSLGIMAFELLTGRVPFASDSVRALLQMHVRMPVPNLETLRPGVPDDLARFVRGALEKRPDRRLSDWDAIRSLLRGAPREAPRRRDVLTLDYPEDARADVEVALLALRTRLDGLPEVRVARARLED